MREHAPRLEVLYICSDRPYDSAHIAPRIAGSANGKSFCLAPERIFQSIGFILEAVASMRTIFPLIAVQECRLQTSAFQGHRTHAEQLPSSLVSQVGL